MNDRVDCAVGISGAYEFDDRTPENYGIYNPDPVPSFAGLIENYTGTDVPSAQHAVSPVTLVTSSAKPVLLTNSIHDFMPYHQIVDMICALEEAGLSEANGDFGALTIPGNDHSFACWSDWDGNNLGPTKLVKSHVIEFLDLHLK